LCSHSEVDMKGRVCECKLCTQMYSSQAKKSSQTIRDTELETHHCKGMQRYSHTIGKQRFINLIYYYNLVHKANPINH